MEYNDYFIGYGDRLEKLENLHKKKMELKEILKYIESNYTVEFCGLPRTGKTNTVGRIFSFFKSAGIDVSIAKEPARIMKEMYNTQELKQFSRCKFNDKALEISRENLERLKQSKNSIILMDRGVMDNYFWYESMLNNASISNEEHEEKTKYMDEDLDSIDMLNILIADPKEIIKRDYLNEIYLDKRNKTTIENCTNLYSCYLNLYEKIKSKKEEIYLYDNTKIDEIDTAITIANNIIDGYSKKLIKSR